jgi:hypothetical protein
MTAAHCSIRRSPTSWSINAVAWIYGHDAGIVGELEH